MPPKQPTVLCKTYKSDAQIVSREEVHSLFCEISCRISHFRCIRIKEDENNKNIAKRNQEHSPSLARRVNS
jgi:hypothetical protein